MADKTVSLYDGNVIIDFDDAKHVYTTNISEYPIPGVTTILRRLNKPALVQWAANQASAYIQAELTELLSGSHDREPWRMSDVLDICKSGKTAHRRFSRAAADTGTEVHAYAEGYTRAFPDGGPPEMPDEGTAAEAGASAFREWFHQHLVEPFAVERIVFSKNYYFCGTCDFYGKIDDEVCIMDYKTSSGIYPEMLLQLAAYGLALREELGTRIDTGYIIRLDKKTGKPHVHKIPLQPMYETAFINCLETDKLMKKIEEQMDGFRKAEQ